ncbi:MAG TPA: hypothetical protein VJU59_27335 [Paraburkholderia sp.]|uniref:hypothetical protein n=1 Tax=Paraburkholderia sp. TaxID=1926495 RepID=UPI002B45B35F|nr:hypothetical protein [Paraburkholderia sp.]HKR43353.1 hypothetical protein [Paraburkholderia sp.]
MPRRHIPGGVRMFDAMNASAKTVGEKRSFSGAWKKQQLALIACDAFYEPNYERRDGSALEDRGGRDTVRDHRTVARVE